MCLGAQIIEQEPAQVLGESSAPSPVARIAAQPGAQVIEHELARVGIVAGGRGRDHRRRPR